MKDNLGIIGVSIFYVYFFVAHNIGKCAVKSGNYLDMYELKSTFDDLDINCELEEYASGMY